MLNDNAKGNVNYLICRGMVLKEIRYNKSAAQKFENQDYATGYLSALSAIEGFLAGLPAVGVPNWINVNEKLPEKGQRVMYLSVGRDVICTGPYHSVGVRGAHYFMSGNRLESAKWWMPLPELPKEEHTR